MARCILSEEFSFSRGAFDLNVNEEKDIEREKIFWLEILPQVTYAWRNWENQASGNRKGIGMSIRGIHARTEARAVAESGVGARAIRGGEVCEAGASTLHWDGISTNQGGVVPFQNNDNI